MNRLFPEKLITIIVADVLEEMLVETVRRRGASGYTLIRARGAGAHGPQSGTLWADTNLSLQVVLPPERLPGLLDDLEALIDQGHHLTVFVTDVAVLGREKFERSLLA